MNTISFPFFCVKKVLLLLLLLVCSAKSQKSSQDQQFEEEEELVWGPKEKRCESFKKNLANSEPMFLASKDGSLKKEEMKKKGRSLEREVEETRAGLKSEEEKRERENSRKI